MEGIGASEIVNAACLLMVVTGVIVIAWSQEPVRKVSSLSSEMMGEKVFFSGVITRKNVFQGHVFLRVNNYKAVIFEDQARKMQSNPYLLSEGDHVTFVGEVQEYEGELELVVEEVVP